MVLIFFALSPKLDEPASPAYFFFVGPIDTDVPKFLRTFQQPALPAGLFFHGRRLVCELIQLLPGYSSGPLNPRQRALVGSNPHGQPNLDQAPDRLGSRRFVFLLRDPSI
jgi:hypothetical protein